MAPSPGYGHRTCDSRRSMHVHAIQNKADEGRLFSYSADIDLLMKYHDSREEYY